MNGLSQYILSVICAAVICGLVQLLFDRHSGTFQIIRLTTGLIMTLIVLQPVLSIEKLRIDDYLNMFDASSDLAVQSGQDQAIDSLSEIIIQKTETYILDKAEDMGATITAQVELNREDPPVPSAVIIRGSVSPYIKRQLSNLLKTELGINEENQLWF